MLGTPTGPCPARDIVIIDDDVRLTSLLALALQQRGYSVRAKADIKTGVETLQDRLPMLLILDLNLPDGSGWGALNFLRELPCGNKPVLVISSENVSRKELRERGIAGFIPKPLDIEEVVAKVDGIFAG
jgi:DNA-binding response OmpR family regulator